MRTRSTRRPHRPRARRLAAWVEGSIGWGNSQLSSTSGPSDHGARSQNVILNGCQAGSGWASLGCGHGWRGSARCIDGDATRPPLPKQTPRTALMCHGPPPGRAVGCATSCRLAAPCTHEMASLRRKGQGGFGGSRAGRCERGTREPGAARRGERDAPAVLEVEREHVTQRAQQARQRLGMLCCRVHHYRLEPLHRRHAVVPVLLQIQLFLLCGTHGSGVSGSVREVLLPLGPARVVVGGDAELTARNLSEYFVCVPKALSM